MFDAVNRRSGSLHGGAYDTRQAGRLADAVSLTTNEQRKVGELGKGTHMPTSLSLSLCLSGLSRRAISQ